MLAYLPALACPVGMGLMMTLMMRSKRQAPTAQPTSDQQATPTKQERELAELRSEISALREDRSPATPPINYTAS
jgi:hypothetical protein